MDDDNQPNSGPIGYGNPPAHARFKKGTSGNLKGRPKGTRNLAIVLERTLREKVIINENGIRKTITKLEAAVKQLVNKAASGDLVAMRQLSALAGSAEIQAAASQKESSMVEADQKIMSRLLERLQKSNGRNDSVNNK
jgi:predicted phosphohydrolase